MREQLIQYVELLFAGARDCEDIKQEILQNTLDRYDDLIAEGKVPEAAYRLAITGIGDINEILGTKPQPAPVYHAPIPQEKQDNDTPVKKLLRAIAVGLYILCPLPLIVLSEFFGWDILGLCGTLSIVAVATVLIMLGSKKSKEDIELPKLQEVTPETELQKSVGGMIWTIGLALYFLLSFTTNAWHLTWLIFPITAAVRKLAVAIMSKGEPDSVRKAKSCIWVIGLIAYFVVSFTTMAWYITWLIFPITAAVQGLARAILDLKEAVENEA